MGDIIGGNEDVIAIVPHCSLQAIYTIKENLLIYITFFSLHYYLINTLSKIILVAGDRLIVSFTQYLIDYF